jgi:two-component system sensor histidine kinase TctE
MKRPRWPLVSIRRLLLMLLVPGMLVVASAELWVSWRTASDAADAAYDRSLLGAVKSIDSSISTASGGLGVELPYRMLEFFELTAQGQVFYRVATEDGLVEIGSPDLPLPPHPLETDKPQFHEGTYFGQAVRVGSYARELRTPVAGAQAPQRVIVQVAETLEARHDFRRSLLLRTLARDVLLVLVASGLLLASIAWAMSPLDRFRQEVEGRPPGDLTPMNPEGVPAEVLPLVHAVNHHIARSREQAEARRRFVDDATHQLRTPLATLSTQVAYAQREPDPQRQREALGTIRQQLDRTIQQTNQLLALARADEAPLALQAVDAVGLAEAITRETWSTAREQGVDLGLDAPERAMPVRADPDLLREALGNLLQNAIRHTGAGTRVTVHLREQPRTDAPPRVCITVADDGPGLPPEDIARLGERFFRGQRAHAVPGSGLGLAFVRTVAQRHGGELRVTPGEDGRGLRVTLVLPALAASAQAAATAG